LLIGIDVGNTNSTVGIFADAPGELTPLQAWRFTTKQYMTADEMAAPIIAHLMHAGLSAAHISAGVVACVVPSLERSLRLMLEGVFGLRDPLFVDSATDCGLKYAYPNPSEIGADRIVNAAAGIALYGAPLLIIDFGTATTFCCISRAGEYLGGQILPGVEVSLQALTVRAEKLSSVSIVRPRQVIGKSTADGMAAGIYYQTIGALELITQRIREEMGESNLKIIATGGLAGLFSADWPGIGVIDQDMTLKGLKLIHERYIAKQAGGSLWMNP
jgi:type III pantothenate kinase